MASSAPLQAVKLKAWAPICHASSAVQSDLPLAQPVPTRSPPLSSPFVGLVWFKSFFVMNVEFLLQESAL
jgi:hypothetical protein